MFTAKELLDGWKKRLTDAGVECAFAESQWIYCHLSGKKRSEIFWEQNQPCPQSIADAGEEIVRRRIAREPLQYILGTAPFMDIELTVTPAVLIPRPETEILAEWLIKNLPSGGRMLDTGTGSGAIALSVAFARPDAEVLALDISNEALAVAAGNCRRLGLADRVHFRHSDLLSAVTRDEKFDILAANLPYVADAEYAVLEPEVREHEPKLALTADDEGLALIFRLADDTPRVLKPGGAVIFEHGHNHAPRLTAYLSAAGVWQDIKVIKDYNHVERFTAAVLRRQVQNRRKIPAERMKK